MCFENLINYLNNLFNDISLWISDKMIVATPIKSSEGIESIFNFSDFISALALLTIVYTISDFRYKFRIAVAPLNLLKTTYYSIFSIGLISLFSDLFFTKGYRIPFFLNDQILIQFFLAVWFLLILVLWLYYAFIKPSIFSKSNFRRYTNVLYQIILKGSDNELIIVSDELAKSVSSIVKYSRLVPDRWDNENKQKKTEPSIEDYAHDLILLIGNRKFCKHIISSSPHTAILFFQEMTHFKKYRIPMGQFAQNITTEAILNSDSLLYHEDHGYNQGLIGYIKPFSKAVFGNSYLVSELAEVSHSPLDIDYKCIKDWNATQYKAYANCFIIFLSDYLKQESWHQHSFAFHRALGNIEKSFSDLYKLDRLESDYYYSDIYQRLRVAVDFVNDFIELIEKNDVKPSYKLKRKKDDRHKNEDIYDKIAHLQFEIIIAASSIKSPSDKCWWIQHNTVWGEFFGLKDSETRRIIQYKLKRLLFIEIIELNDWPNFKGSKILGFCLNVMGLKLLSKKDYRKDCYSLNKVLINWTAKNYLSLREKNIDVAEDCLAGSITFDEKNSTLVKTYIKGLSKEAPKDVLQLI